MALFYSPRKKTPQSAPKKITLTIDKLDGLGQGIGYYHDKPVFVANALPNEEVEVILTESKRTYFKGRIHRYLSTQPNRETPKCAHFGQCGGCQMQHIPWQEQHKIKQEHIAHLFKSQTNAFLKASDVDIIADQPYHYRRRARIALHYKSGKLAFGFRSESSNEIINISQCPVLTARLEHLLVPLRVLLESIQSKSSLGHLELIDVESGISVILRVIQGISEKDRTLLREFAEEHQITFYLHHKTLECLSGNSTLYYQVGALKLSFSPLNFFQVNQAINLKMIDRALNLLEVNQHDHLLDLFCGMGNFSLPLAQKSAHVIAVEGVPELVKQANRNNELNQSELLHPVAFFTADLTQMDKTPVWYHDKIDKMLLDPSREGAASVIPMILTQKPKAILYISCHPATLTRDCLPIIQSEEYDLIHVAILDMFPQTKHIESMVLFKKRHK